MGATRVMNGLSLYDWSVLGMLFLITLSTLAIAWKIGGNFERLTKRIERAIENLADRLETQ